MWVKSKAGGRFRASLGICTVLLIVGLVFSGDARAATLNVPGTYATIQLAITAASDGDIVLVDDGIYTENITFETKVITVRSENGAASTTIDGSGSGSVVIINADGTLDGFTVTNGSAAVGGGVLCADSTSPIIRNCVIDSNEATGEGGGGIGIGASASPTIQSCTISNNTAVNASPPVYIKGGGIHCGNLSSPTIKNCKFINNSANYGGAIAANTASPTITNCTFNGNTATDVGGAISCTNSSTTVLNSIFWEDLEAGSTGGELRGNSYTVTYSDVQGGYTGTGNINSNPQFVDTTDYHLKNTSPCRDTGNPTSPDYDDKDGSRNDMGADGGPDGVEDTEDPTISPTADPMSSTTAPAAVTFTSNATDDWGIASYSWDFGDGDTSSGQNPNHTYDNCSGYTANLTVTDNSGRTSSTTVGPITVGGTLPTASASTTPTPAAAIATSESIIFSGSASGGSGSYTWLWTFGDGNISIEEDPIYTYTTPGAYTATLKATDDLGCYDDSTVNIDVTIVSSACSSVEYALEVSATDIDTVDVEVPGGSTIAGTKVAIPPGVLSQDTVIAISKITSPPAFPTDIKGIGAPVDFAPDGTSFSSDVTITLAYEDSQVTSAGISENEIRIYFYDTSVSPNRWREEITNKAIDTTDNKVSVDVDHFTFFALAGGVPTPPSGLTATATSDTVINLNWTINSSDETGFSVERSENSGLTYGPPIGTVGAGISVYEDNGLNTNTEYWYQVRAENTYGYSPYSNEASTVTQDPGGSIDWVATYNGSGNEDDIASDIALSPGRDYVYVTGARWNTSNNYDYVLIKYKVSPEVSLPSEKAPEAGWPVYYDRPGVSGDDIATALAVDSSGNVYVTGKSMNGSGNYDYVTIKYDSSGVEQWSSTFAGGTNGAGHDVPVDIAVDNSGNVYVTGTSYQSEAILIGHHDGTPATYVAAGDDYATVKYNASGVQQWAAIYDGLTPYLCGGEGYYCNNNGKSDHPTALVVVDSGSYPGVYVTGLSEGDDTPEGDYLTVKYNLDGTQLWDPAARYNGPGDHVDEALGIVVDDTSGDVYVTGRSRNNSVSNSNFDYATLKYNSSGVQQLGWPKRYNGSADADDEAWAIVKDSLGNVYVTGLAMETSGGTPSENYRTISYDSAGTQRWSTGYNGAYGGSDRAYALGIDDSNSGIYLTGTSGNSYVNIKYNLADGSLAWPNVVTYNGSEYDIPKAITVDNSGNAYIVGVSETESDNTGDDIVTIMDAPSVDDDWDGMDDNWEYENGVDDPDDDPDGDGLTNLQEYELGTNPQNPDTDEDGMDDDWEVDNGLDPLDADDADGDLDNDGYSNLTEYNNGTNPQQASAIYYVDDGAAAGGDGTQGQPYQTIVEALAAVNNDDTTISVAAGTYFPKEDLLVPEGVKLIGERWFVCTIDLWDTSQIQLGSYSTLRGFNIVYPPDERHAVEVHAATSITITNNVIRGNPFAQPGLAAIFLDESSGRVENNTIDGGHTGDGWHIGIRTKAADGSSIVNNIMLNNEYGWGDTDSSTLTVDYNNFWNNTNNPNIAKTNNISADPLFVDLDGLDEVSGDYHLQATSPCRNTGSEAAEYNDKDGSRNDMGADGGPGGVQDENTPKVQITSATEDAPWIVNFTATASDEWGIATWAWDFGDGNVSSEQYPSHTYDNCGKYIVTLTVKDHSDRPATTRKDVVVGNPSTVLAVSPQSANGVAPLSIDFSGSADVGPPPYTWAWDFDDSDGIQEDSSLQDDSHIYTTPGSYTATLTVTDADGCRISAIIPITVLEDFCSVKGSLKVEGNRTATIAVSDPDSPLNGATVEIPAGAVSNDTVITISEVTDPPVSTEVSGLGVFVDFGPDGTVFSEAVTIRIPYPAGVADPYALKLYYYDADEGSWVEIEVESVDTDLKVLVAKTSHFTLFGFPTAPTSLTADAVSESKIDLRWNDNSSDEDGFSIERKTGGGAYTEVATVGADVESYQDTGLSVSTEYCYQVRAYNASGESGYSNEACDTTQATSSKSVGGSGGGGGGGGGGCFIATAVYGTSMAKEVRILSLFRDEYLLTNTLGKRFVAFYYKYSPPIAEYIAQKESLRKLARIALWPFVAFGLFMLKMGLVEKLAVIVLLLISGYLLPRYVHKLLKQPS